MSSFSDLPSLLAFHISHVSMKQAEQILAHFGSFKVALQAKESDWRALGVLNDYQRSMILGEELPKLVEQAQEWGAQEGQSFVAFKEGGYPDLLAAIDDAPILLSVRGCVDLLSDPQLAIVGSRHASKQGINIAKDFAQHLSKQGLTITSGLALGIDAAAHEGALQGIGKTVAVVATGLDRIYPASNQKLGRQIAEEGVMVSEFPLGTQPLARYFPRRNRIISGLSVGTLVVEAALKSGSLITARTAINQGREVFAVPGSINNPQAKGCHQLIKQGAKLVESGQDIFEELSAMIQLSLIPQIPAPFSLDRSSKKQNEFLVKTPVLKHIGYDAIGLDELVVLSKCPVYDIQSQLMLLELEGIVESLSAGRWRRIN
ncbi:MAG: DNA processing protein [Thiomicrorhabdus sp.]|nr:MAG: DNA processing protein [Thiomicrorhabdus sp.]